MAPIDARAVEHIVLQIKPLLAGKPPALQGAVLADLLAIFLAGHHPTLRGEILQMHIEAVRSLIKPNEALLFPDGKPAGWELDG
jgi:hypothetical protein